ncbi:MAG: MFS transporter [Pseudomonadota bacterium]
MYRFRILALLLGLSVVTSLDRVNISVAAQRIMPEYGLDAITMGNVFSASTLGYALFQIPGGWLTDRLSGHPGALSGRRRVAMLGFGLTALCIMLGATAVQPLWAVFFLSLCAGWLFFAVTPFWSMVIEISPGRAGAVAGIMNTGGNLGGVLSPVAIPWLGQHYGWSVALATAVVRSWLRSRSHG